MREYDNKILEEIRDELSIIWAAHKIHGLKGKMRIYTVSGGESWVNKEEGAEMWLDPTEIDAAVKKIGLFYREGKDNKSSLMLDPMVYTFNNEGKPLPVGSGIFWATILTPTTDKELRFTPKSLSRIKELGLFASPIRMEHNGEENKRAGIKIMGFLKTPITPSKKMYSPHGTHIAGMNEIIDLIDAKATIQNKVSTYLLSGLNYTSTEGNYLHPRFKKLLGDKQLVTVDDLNEVSIDHQIIQNAAICWNGYERDHNLYLRYGVDILNLKSNLENKAENDRAVEKIKTELRFFWRANLRHGLDGFMRLYTSPNQDNWRSYEEGKTIWYTNEEESLNDTAEQIQRLYNGGILPNTPLLLDPIVYTLLSDGTYIPSGTGIIWSTAINVGLSFFNPAGEERIKSLGLMTGQIVRAGEDPSGLKIIGFLNEPYIFSNEEVMTFIDVGLTKNDADEEEENLFYITSNDNADEGEQEDLADEEEEEQEDNATINDDDDDDYDDDDEEEESAEDPFFLRDFLALDSCYGLNKLYGSNAEKYSPFFLLSSVEYLCTNGSFMNTKMDDEIGQTEEEHMAIIEKYSIPYQKVLDAYDCWEAYDHVELLWKKYGIDKANLEENLKYYVLCGRNFEFLGMLDDDNSTLDEGGEATSETTFNFVADGMLAANTITVLAGANTVGKSTIAHKIALLASADYAEDEEPDTWLGTKVFKENCKGLTIYFSGKDSQVVCKSRAKIMFPDKQSKRLLVKYDNDFGEDENGNKLDITNFLKQLDSLSDVSLVVIDSARKFINGDEDDKEAVGDFFDALQKFAAKKECAVLVVHHTERDASPSKATEMLSYLKGCDLFAERPTVIIGLLKEGAKYYIGLAKNGLPPSLETLKGEAIFSRNEERLDLAQLPGDEGIRLDSET